MAEAVGRAEAVDRVEDEALAAGASQGLERLVALELLVAGDGTAEAVVIGQLRPGTFLVSAPQIVPAVASC